MATPKSMLDQACATSISGPVEGNYFDKYRSRNPIHRALVGNFLRRTREFVAAASPSHVLEVGCANGDFAARLFGWGAGAAAGTSYVGTDISREQIAHAK